LTETIRPRAVTFIRVPAVSAERTAAYEQWYDSIHIPLRMTKPGFLGAQRYDVITGEQRYLVLYELADATAPEGDQYVALRRWEAAQPPDSFEAPGLSRPGFERGIYDQISGPTWPDASLRAPVIHIAGHDVDPDDTRYLSALENIAGVSAVRRFALTSKDYGPGTGMLTPHPRMITVSYLDSESLLSDESFTQAHAAVSRIENAPHGGYVTTGRLRYTASGCSDENISETTTLVKETSA
jgi:hypothetical protein